MANGSRRLVCNFSLSCPSARRPGLEWYEESEETHAPQIELLETPAAQELPGRSEPFRPRGDLVPVVFPGPVSQEGCCQFTCELLKHVMYQRLQLPLPYEQLKRFSRQSSPQVGTGFPRKLVGRLHGRSMGGRIKKRSKESSGFVRFSSWKECVSSHGFSHFHSLTLPTFSLVFVF